MCRRRPDHTPALPGSRAGLVARRRATWPPRGRPLPRFSAGSARRLSLRARLTPCAPFMFAFDSAAEGWLLAAMLLCVPLVFAQPHREAPDTRRSWLLALIALSAPLFCPTRGVASTVVTGLAVVVATRLPDLGTRSQGESALSRTLWFMTPIVRCVPADAARRSANR